MKNPKCPSSFFTRLFHSPRHNLAWCKVFITAILLPNRIVQSSSSMILTGMDKVPKAGSSTWVENFLLLANQTEAAISSMVGESTQVSPNDNLTGPSHETPKDGNTLSTHYAPRPVERHRQLKPDLYGGSVRAF